jgi:hypothetical protein
MLQNWILFAKLSVAQLVENFRYLLRCLFICILINDAFSAAKIM